MKKEIIKRIANKFNKKECTITSMIDYSIKEGYTMKESEILIEKFLMQ